MNEPLVSVVVPTRNSAKTLDSCLSSVRAQTYPHVELIVVDNFSRDDTVEIARHHTGYVLTAGPERSAQRNLGVRHAHGEYLLFLDSDMVLHPDVIGECVECLQRVSSSVAVIIPELSVGEGFWAQCKALERACYIGDDAVEAARFFVRTTFEAVGGFDENLNAFEDWDLAQRIREHGATRRISTSIRHLEGHLTLLETMRSKFYYGRSAASYLRKHSERTIGRQFIPVRVAYLRHWRLLAADPFHLAGFVVMKTCEIFAGGAGALTAVRLEMWQGRKSWH